MQYISPNILHFLAIVFVEEVVEFMIDIVERQRILQSMECPLLSESLLTGIRLFLQADTGGK
jgi:hypothetical protein